MSQAKRDENRIPTILGVSSADDTTPIAVYADPTTHRLLVDVASGGTTTVDAGTTTTGNAGTNASVVNSGTTTNAVFDFTIPRGNTGAAGANGTNGTDGASAFVYIAYASDASGTGFTMTFDAALDYIAVKNTTVAIPSPSASDFTGLWKNYKGATGNTGATGAIGITWHGAYDNAHAYVINDGVYYLGSSYINIQAGTGNLPTNAAFWSLIALKGTDGIGSGDVMGPATNTDSYIPQWNGANSKTLKDGLAVPAGGLAGITALNAKGDVFGPASATDSHLAAFDTTTGKLIKDSGYSASDFTTALGNQLHLDQTTPQSVINGKPVFSDGIKFGATPTVGAFANGKMYYDVNYKTMAVNIADDVNLQIGQESHTFVKNTTGSSIPNGAFVYINGVSAGVSTIALAKADAHATSEVAGCTTQVIANGATGLITNRGEVHDVNTATFTAGDSIYLSDTSAGVFTNVVPAAGSIKVRLGRVLEVDASVGEILVSVVPELGLGDLSNVVLTSPALDNTLRFNGTEWVNGTSPISAGVGIDFFNASPTITASSTNNSFPIVSLLKTPVTTVEQTISGTAATNTVTFAGWLYNTALGRTVIDSGVWDFAIYAAVNSVAAGRVTTITRNMFCAKPFATGTVTTTGTGTSRTATASAGTPFATTEIDASATNTVASYLQTPQGLYQITARTSDTVVTILVPTTYANESAVGGTVWKKLFGITSPTITSTGTNYSLYTTQSVQPAFTITATCKLGVISYVTSNATTTVTTTYDGTTHNTNFSTPLITLHNNLAGLQGGTSNEFYHLTSAQATVVGNTSGTNTGDNTVATALTGTPSITVATVTTTGNIELGHASDTTIARVSAGVISVEGVTVDTISATNTLTNKRINPRIVSTTSYTTDTGTSLDVSTCDEFVITAQAGALKFNNPSGTPVEGNKLIIRIKDNGTARALTWDTQYRAMGTALPSTTVLGKTLYLGLIWNNTDTKFDMVASAQEA